MTGPASTTPRLRLHVSPAAERAVRRGHPWVFADRIRDQNRPGDAGELAVLYDGENRFLALGLFDPASPLRVRVLHRGPPVTLDDAWWTAHLTSALARRADLFTSETTGGRWIHGESDGWPGLVLDRYGDVLVLKLYTEAWLPRIHQIRDLLVKHLQPASLVLRLSRNITDTAAQRWNLLQGQILAGRSVSAPVVFLENGLRFEADVLRGQKTGFFLDQRENRDRVGRLAGGARVLNAFSFSGGFSLYAARGGAREVVDLDISPYALASAQRNFALNRHLPGVAAARHETLQADTFEWLARDADTHRFDLVILDPPSMARRAQDRAGAIAAYETLARLGAARVRPGGILLAASCSAQVPAETFFTTVHSGVTRARRRGTELARTAHPADHPAGFPEAHYLKAVYLRLE